jgi:transcriptional regulator with PAS, ATPase and Fis domain
MRELYRRIEAVGRARAIALVVGESGTGKELVARAVHECGPNPNAPFVPLNCAALPKELIESELFGYKRGAFTGAATEYLGLFRAAEGGTLFLDEVTEMNPDTQSKLLRAIQERKVRPVGSSTEVSTDVRVIASTNRDPEQALKDKQFRQDLYYRLQASTLRVPPLRDRAEDIPLLSHHFIDLFNQKLMRPTHVDGIEDNALQALSACAWPGNVRELSNAIEAAFIFGRTPMIELRDLPPAIGGKAEQSSRPASSVLVGTFAEAERDIIARALEMSGGNKVHAARTLKISRKRLYAKIEKYGLE